MAFMSYAHLNNRKEQLTAFGELLGHEVLEQTGEEFHIFQDRKDIKWGQNWQERIEESLDRVTFLIAFITPSYFKSQPCQGELRRFLKREEELGRNDLILPVYYVDCEQAGDEEMLEEDELARAIFSRQYIDWRDLRFQPMDSLLVGERMSRLAAQIRDALWRVKESENVDAEKSISQQFTEQIKDIPPEEAYSFITEYTARLLSSTRASLMVQDENQPRLSVRAAIGPHAGDVLSSQTSLDAGISGIVMHTGRPLVVGDISASEYKQAPADHGYETNSFICFPIILRGKSSFILNFTDKADGGTYNESDLRTLEAIAPYIALALDRTQLHHRLIQFQLLSTAAPGDTKGHVAGEWKAPSPESVAGEKSENRLGEAGERESGSTGPLYASADNKRLKADRRDGEGEYAAAIQMGMLAPALTPAEAYICALKNLCETQGLKSIAVMLSEGEKFTPAFMIGQFETQPPKISLKAKEIKLLLAAMQGNSIVVPADGGDAAKHDDSVELFPLIVGEEIKGVLLVGDENISDEQRGEVAAFCRDLSMPLEVMRLRGELERRTRATSHLRAFTDVVNLAQPDEAYVTVLRHSAELLCAERASLMLYDEQSGELVVKAAIGPRAEVVRESRIYLGEGISGAVLREGRPIVVRDVSAQPDWSPAPVERGYKTRSFIIYPIVIGGRRVGVINVTDKADGGTYDELDLGLLDMIAPQIVLVLDRAEWHRKATQFQLLSITDPLTGLVNRRYLEERLSEELDRSKRYSHQMSFMMIDMDDFKQYNDSHGHQAGDIALEMTAQCLKTALRSADVMARYGGEEFAVLLPQTSIGEAVVIGERIRRRVERTVYPYEKGQPSGAVTISIGISAFGPDTDTSASVIYAADQALYMAKSRGKNCVQAHRG
jgi:diguanylate cyclase (GGDEF)-like protein